MIEDKKLVVAPSSDEEYVCFYLDTPSTEDEVYLGNIDVAFGATHAKMSAENAIVRFAEALGIPVEVYSPADAEEGDE